MADYRYFFEKNYSSIRQTAIGILEARSEHSPTLNSFNSHHFEWFCNYYLLLKGWDVVDMSIADEHHADGGIDGVLKKDGKYLLIQSKKQNSFESSNGRLSVKVLREFSGVLSRDKAKYKNLSGAIMTSGVFTRDFLRESPDFPNIELFDLNRFKSDPIVKFIAQSNSTNFKFGWFSKLKIRLILFISALQKILKTLLNWFGFLSDPIDYAKDKVDDIRISTAKLIAAILAGFLISIILISIIFWIYTTYIKEFLVGNQIDSDLLEFTQNVDYSFNSIKFLGFSDWQMSTTVYGILSLLNFSGRFKTRSRRKFTNSLMNLIGVILACVLILFLDLNSFFEGLDNYLTFWF